LNHFIMAKRTGIFVFDSAARSPEPRGEGGPLRARKEKDQSIIPACARVAKRRLNRQP
jgi:hypothetical protein